MKQGSDNVPFYADVRVILPSIIIILLLLASGATAAVCLKHRKIQSDQKQQSELGIYDKIWQRLHFI